MKRRDTIIIAVLVNAGLLIILFATAMRSNKGEKTNTSIESTQIVDVKEPSMKEEGAPFSREEVDQILNQYIASPSEMPSPSSTSEEILFSDEIASSLMPLDPSPQPVPMPVTPLEERREVTHEGPKYVSVTVKKGDFLEKIAKANGSTVSEIMKANRMESTQLKIGQVLRVPVKDGQKMPSLQGSSQEEFYIVREGDNPWVIASKHKVKVEELLRLNGLDQQKAKKLRPGDKLRIR